MNFLRITALCCLSCAVVLVMDCSKKGQPQQPSGAANPAPVLFFRVDPANSGSITGTIRYNGPKPVRHAINMSEDPACVEAHHGKAYDESLLVSATGGLGNAFVYIERGLEGKNFEVPATPVTIDQSGCWFRPRILGIQTNQELKVINSDPVTHNIHPMAQINREWNHSQGPGDAPLIRRFIKPEVMIPVKCNIHSWMHAFIGVVEHPYFAVSKEDGSFTINNLPPGTYTLAVWQQNLGTQEQQLVVPPHGSAITHIVFRRK